MREEEDRSLSRRQRACLKRGYRIGRKAHPRLELPFRTYARGILDRHHDHHWPGDTEAADWRKLHWPDLYLAIGCEAGSEAAWEELHELYVDRLARILMHMSIPAQLAREVAGDLPGMLLCTPRQGARSLLAGYDGTGPLLAWLAVIAGRAALRSMQRQFHPRFAPVRDIEDRALDPIARVSHREAAERLAARIDGALQSLDPRDRLVLICRFRDGMAVAEIARLLNVSKPRVSQLLRRALGQVRETLGPEAPSTPSPDEWDTIREVLSLRLARLPLRPSSP